MLKEIALKCDFENGKCIVTSSDYESIKNQKRAIPFETVIKMLERTGLQLNTSVGSVAVSNDRYPHMFSAMSALAKAADNSVKNPVSKSLKYLFAQNYDYLEFRQVFENYKPKYYDVVRCLSDSNRMIVEELYKHAKEYKLCESVNYFYIEYQYKSKTVMSVWLDNWWLEPHGEQK